MHFTTVTVKKLKSALKVRDSIAIAQYRPSGTMERYHENNHLAHLYLYQNVG